MAKSCQAAVAVCEWPAAGLQAQLEASAYAYGKNLGLAFQLVDDKLDVCQSSTVMGKPTGHDLKLGLVTAPVLFAAREHPELVSLFSRNGDKLSHDDILRVS